MHLEMSCHCGNVKIKLLASVETLTQCNCSICFSVGALWGYFSPQQVEINTGQPTIGYLWGAQTMQFHHCPGCGCNTHYLTTKNSSRNQVAVNFRLLKECQLQDYKIRKYDGASR